MKRILSITLVLMAILALAGCGKQTEFTVKIRIPAGSTEEFVYSDEEISPMHQRITIAAGKGLGDTSVILKPVDVKEENAYEPTYLTPGMPVEMDAERGGWFKIGVSMQNPTDKDMEVFVIVNNVNVRIS